jgi:hypothetical protein
MHCQANGNRTQTKCDSCTLWDPLPTPAARVRLAVR